MKKLSTPLLLLILAAILAACGGSDEEPETADNEVEEVAAVEDESVAEVEEVAEEPTPIPEEPTAIPPTATPEPTNTPEPTPTPAPFLSEPVFYSNGNYTDDVTIFDGTLWTAGSGGLVAYDMATGEGRKYTHFDGLPNVATYSFTTCPVNGENRLLLGFQEGVLLYNSAADSWEPGSDYGITTDDRMFEIYCDASNSRLFLEDDDISIIDLATSARTDLNRDDHGLASFSFDDFFQVGDDVWASSYQGLSIIAPDNSVTVLGEDQGTWPSDDITDAHIGPDNKLWIAASEGIYHQTGDGLTADSFKLFDRNNSEAINYWGPEYIEFSADGQLWAAFNSELCQFSIIAGTCAQAFSIADMGLSPDASIDGFKVAEDGSLLVHTNFNGAARYDGESWTAFTLNDQTPHNYFKDFYQTSDGKIWTTGWSLAYTDINAEEWTKPEGLYGDRMAEAADGSLWFSTSSKVTHFDGQKIVEYTADDNGLLDESINAMTIDAAGNVYLGGYRGYSMIGADGETIIAVGEDQGWEIGNIRALVTAGDTVYAGTTEGLVTLSGDSWETVIDESFIVYGNNSTGSLNVLNGGDEALGLAPNTIILGTEDGLMYWDGTTLSSEEAVTGAINDIFVDQETGEIYVTANRNGGDNAGFYSYSPNSGWSFMNRDEFPSDSMLGVFKDAEGTVWVSSGDSTWGGGIVRMP